LGMKFHSRDEAREVIKTHCFRRGKSVSFDKIESLRVVAYCRTVVGCPWFVRIARSKNGGPWQLRCMNEVHAEHCGWDHIGKSIKSSWLAKAYLKKIREDPNMKPKTFRKVMSTSLNVEISKYAAYRARKRAINIMHGHHMEQFNRIYNYLAEVKRKNPDVRCVMRVQPSARVKKQFQRLYFCFGACRDGFLVSCRPLVGLDGCFLKGSFEDELLVAIGLDPNNSICPIAWAMVEGENKSSWTWFLNLLKFDLKISEENMRDFTFMSDKDKGLTPALQMLFPTSHFRFCVRHLYENMKKKGFGSAEVKMALWMAARATRQEIFNSRMAELKELNKDAHKWLEDKPPQQWSRAFFDESVKCDTLLNNMSESFNSCIIEARGQPIIQLFETIRNLVMVRLQSCRENAAKWSGGLCPRITQLLEKSIAATKRCSAAVCNDGVWQITDCNDSVPEQFIVDLVQKSCSCRRWSLTGIPCGHAVKAMWCSQKNPSDGVYEYYSVETYKKCYAGTIFGIDSYQYWPAVDKPALIPPLDRKKRGRPKTLRKRAAGEPPPGLGRKKVKGTSRPMKCKRCSQPGHNSRTCK
ncbi:hypothetical protein M569_10068, partial [Genlisea aurea]